MLRRSQTGEAAFWPLDYRPTPKQGREQAEDGSVQYYTRSRIACSFVESFRQALLFTSTSMSNPTDNRKAKLRMELSGEGNRVLDIISETSSLTEWAALLRAPLQHAVMQGDVGLSQKLIRAGADVGCSLHAAAQGGHGEIANLLLEKGASPNAKDGRDETALHYAARHGRVEMARLLLLKGADKDALGTDRRTPLQWAAHAGHAAVAEVLVLAGADINLRSKRSGFSPLDLAARSAHLDVLKLLIDRGVDVNAPSPRHRKMALHVATRSKCSNKTAAIDVLLEAGANIEARDGEGGTPLQVAAGLAHSEAALCLLRHGADVNARATSGSMPLHTAASHAGRRGTAEVVDLLLQWGADETITDNHDRTAADMIGIKARQWYHLTDDVERVRKLLANAPADRAWRRRALPMLCRAHPGRVPLGCSWIGLVVTVAELGEADIFRKIVGYL